MTWSRRGRRPRRVRRRRFGRAGCLLWLIAAILIVLLLALVSGGFRLGSKQGLGGTRISPVAYGAAAYQP